MVSAVDETIGAIYDALEETGMLDNTLIAFSSDVSSTYLVYKMTFLKLETKCLTLRMYLIVFLCFSQNGGEPGGSSNYPLRGSKISIWEGGVRVPGFAYSKKMTKSGYKHQG